MRNSNSLITGVQDSLRQKQAPSSDLPTAAGQTISEPAADYQGHQQSGQQSNAQQPDKIDAINQVFAELELAYHNQYHKAYAGDQNVQLAKQLWFDALRGYSADVILKACRSAIAASEYLPSLHVMHSQCAAQLASYGLTDALSAYREACNAASPKSNQPWTHLAVYYAGRDSDWFLLASEPQARMLPVFEQHYQKWCQRVLAGEPLENPAQPALSDGVAGSTLSASEKAEKMRALRDANKI